MNAEVENATSEPHRDPAPMRCRVIAGHNDSPIGRHEMTALTIEWFAADGTHRGHHHLFVAVKCNAIDCPAEIRAEGFLVGKLIEEHLTERA